MSRLVAALAVLAIAARPVRADDEAKIVDHTLERTESTDEGVHLEAALMWATIQAAIPALYYWNTQSQQREDWTLDWSWHSWKRKLSFDTLEFDTNLFPTNAIRHPLTGIGDYQIARSNGFGAVGSYVFATTLGILWEYLVEYKEDQALNDMIMNSMGGIAIGEPLYQFGQLWRSQSPSLFDRVRTAAFSPFDAVQDVIRHHPLLVRPHGWSAFRFHTGWLSRNVDDAHWHDEASLGIDGELMNVFAYVQPDARTVRTGVGAWSRVHVNFRFGELGNGDNIAGVVFDTRTSLVGRYSQDGDGHGVYVGLGTAFTYHRDRLATTWDHGAWAHLIGPQVQLVVRDGDRALRWDTAGYFDFALVDSHLFAGEARSMLPPPPPLYSTVQAHGYYDGFGLTGQTRLRLDSGPWWVDTELELHRVWQVDALDRATVDNLTTPDMAVPHGIADWRGYAHGSLGFELGHWGLAVDAGAVFRRGTWHSLSRTSSETSIGASATLGF